MKVLLVSDFFPPVRGGLESHVDDLASELADRDHDVHVATLTARPQASHAGVTTHTLDTGLRRVVRHADPDRPFAPPLPDPIARRGLGRILAQLRPDVVHGHSWLAASVPRSAAPLVFTAHDYALICQLQTLWQTTGQACSGPRLSKCASCGAGRDGFARSVALAVGTRAGRRLLAPDAVMVLSEAVRTRIAARLSASVTVTGGFLPVERDVGTTPGLPLGPYVMFAGDPGPHKGLDVLVDIWARPDRPRAVLLLALTKPYAGSLPPDVSVVHLPREHMAAAWRGARVAVVPSRWHEPYGMVAIEALAVGTPVIATAVGALPELVRDGVDGLLVRPGAPDELRGAITRLISDDELRATLSVGASAGAERFAAAQVVPRILAVYESAIARRGST